MLDTRQSVAILGGAFDPVHLGHLSLAEDAMRELKLDEVWFTPTAESPLKDNHPVLKPEDRLKLLELALQPYPAFKINRTELERGGVSYTIETARELVAQFPGTDFFWIIGGDQFYQLGQWKEIRELCKLLKFAVVARPGFEIDRAHEPSIPELQYVEVSSRHLEIASSEIRQKIADGRPVNELLPKSVHDFILKQNFYKTV